ncbi:MAG: 3'-5' exonuclease [Treponema sp.]|jgi:DNA polymerase-3 subunit epsilon|nr:3'-5' exonuclease [Treponema sp.]
MGSLDWIIKAYNEGEFFTAFDIETTGLDPKLDRIVEFGAIKFDRRGIMARYSALINPEIPMPEEAGKVNGISDAMLAGKPVIEETLPNFLKFIQNTLIVAHNAPFDCGFVNETLKRLNKAEGSAQIPFAVLPNRIADTLVLSRECFAGLKSYSLQNLAADLGLSTMNAHRAEDDALLCMKIFIRIVLPRTDYHAQTSNNTPVPCSLVPNP